MSYPLVAVTWDDAHGGGPTVENPSEISHKPIRIETYGRAIKLDDTGITLAGELCEDGLIRNRTFVPKGMIVEIKFLREVKPRKKKAPAEVVPPPEPVV